MDTIDITNVIRSFDIDSNIRAELLIDWNPVYKFTLKTRSYVLKKTRSPLLVAESMVKWTRMLSKEGVRVVVPAKRFPNNPQRVNGRIWIIYPFVKGERYSGKLWEIYEAGKLLGRMHSLSTSNPGFEIYEGFDFEEKDLEKYMDQLDKILNSLQNPMDIDIDAFEEFCFDSYYEEDEILEADLPFVTGSWDFKASNLLYVNKKPMLIDPDNAGYIPRILDLALALLLFNFDSSRAPARVFTEHEWRKFLSGYREYIEPTSEEKEYWEQMLRHVYVDEAVWAILNHKEEWQRKRYQRFFGSLLQFPEQMYKYTL